MKIEKKTWPELESKFKDNKLKTKSINSYRTFLHSIE